MTAPSPHPDSDNLDERETADENQVAGGDSGFSVADKDPSPLSSISAELITHSRYEVLEAIGQGGMGSVYKARHRLMDRLVAIKVIKPELIRNAKAIQRFQREVKAAARLVHPNIVTAFDAEQVGELHLLVMEHVDGIDLAELVKQRGRLSVPVACEYIVQVAAGLQHAFENGMVHRDIKPPNLMMSTSHESSGNNASELSGVTIKILDFGLASFAVPDDLDENLQTASHSITAIGTFIGTPAYVAPEQAQDARQADIRSDIYSLGATLHFLLFGRPPNATEKTGRRDTNQANTESSEGLIDEDKIPDSLRDIIDRMMSSDPKDRFQTPDNVIQALTPFIAVARAPLSRSKDSGPTAISQRSANWWRIAGAALLAYCVIGFPLLMTTWLFDATPTGASVSNPRQTSKTPSPAILATDQRQRSVDAVDRLDVVRDSIIGQWKIEADRLLTPDYEQGLRAVLELPLEVPVQYDLRLVVTRRSDANKLYGGLNVALPFGDSKGMLAVGTHRDVGGCFIERIDGITRHESLPTWTEGFFFKLNESRTVELSVREHEIVVLIDDIEAIRWSGDPNQIEMPPGWEIPDRRSIFLGATGEFAIDRIQFTPVLDSP